jgi:hypothetical protein
VVSDSAGVTIVENEAPTLTEPWAINPQPIARIGDQTGDLELEFFRIRGAVGFADGTFVVANGGTQELRWFSSTGTFLYAAGSAGQGPGEFTVLSRIFPSSNGSIAAYDTQQRRISVFARDGALMESLSFPALASSVGISGPIGAFSEGCYLAVPLGFWLDDPGPTRVEREALEVQKWCGGATAESLGSFPGREVAVAAQSNGIISRGPQRFGREGFVAVDSARWVIGDNDRPEYQVRAATGELTQVVRWRPATRSVSPADLDAHLQQELDRRPGELEWQQGIRAWYAQFPAPPETMPAFSGVILDAADNVWVREYRSPADPPGERFLVFDSAGAWLGNTSLPAGVTALWIDQDYMVGLITDDLGVESVGVFELVKPN